MIIVLFCFLPEVLILIPHCQKMSRSKFSGGQLGERPHISETKHFHGNSDKCGACLRSLTPLHDSLSEHCKPQQSRRSNDFVKDKYRKVDGGGRVAQMKKSEFLWDLLSQHFLQYFESSAQGEHFKVTRCWMDSPCFPFTTYLFHPPLSHPILLLPLQCRQSFPL